MKVTEKRPKRQRKKFKNCKVRADNKQVYFFIYSWLLFNHQRIINKMPTEQIGYASFNLEVPYKVIDRGAQKEKPLVVYLHGYKQNMQYFERRCADLLSLEAYHLFVQGPYPVYDEKHQRKVAEWGRAWYLYDGEQEQFIRSLEETSVFLDQVIANVTAELSVSRVGMLGYSMGGYLAGYFALSRPETIEDLIVMGGRIKTEHFTGRSFKRLNALHLHGAKDQSVGAERSKESCEQLESMGAHVTFKSLPAGHKLTGDYILAVEEWLNRRGYSTTN